MRRCCFLSMDDLSGYVSDDELAIPRLGELGWQVDTVSWRDKTVDWNDFEAVIIRTPWDYQRDPGAFLDVLATIDASSARLENPIDIVKWNLNKGYLRELEANGTYIVPTIWREKGVVESDVSEWLERFGTGEVVIKPTVSATAEFTYRLTEFKPQLTEIFAGREYMVQPFMPNIVTEGEYSLFYFSGEYSHTILKAPKPLDFRVQEEHGGIITAVKPSEKIIDTARSVFELISPAPLYARIDLVRDASDNFALMELELIEPALYFRMDEDSPARFARAFDKMMGGANANA
jgi:glutathione synthase/RimK-type ligase-like ATP-grasp enzyme